MGLEQRIEDDLKAAMKARDAEKLSVLRMVKTALTNAKIARKKETLEESEVLDIVQKQAKQRKESMESFEKAGRTDLLEKETREFAFLSGYLPEQLSDDQIRKLVQKAVAETGAKSKADIGRLMKVLMPAVKGQADGKKVNAIVSECLS